MASQAKMPKTEIYTGPSSDLQGPLVGVRKEKTFRTIEGFCVNQNTPPYFKVAPKTTKFQRRSLRPITPIDDTTETITFSLTTGARECVKFREEAFTAGKCYI